MIEITSKCPANHPCPLVKKCPSGAIKQVGNGLPVIDQNLCTECGVCTLTCPYGAARELSAAEIY
jgi:Fe-S-cluster-containing hydrogenase component 2